jgi:protein O-GlcNAc transferase
MGARESQIKTKKIGRNDLCHCGSGKKYKHCCMQRESTCAGSQELSVPKTMQAALEHHQAGRLPQAEALCRQILQLEPNHPDALHYLGVMAHQVGRNEVAVELISKAIRANPSSPIYYNNFGNALHDQGKLGEAIASYYKALSFEPDFAEAHNGLGNALKDQGKLDEAVASYHKALSFKPDLARAHNNLGLLLQEQGKLDEAVASYHKALSLKPDSAETHNNLGLLLQEQGKLDEAVASYYKALSFKPDHAKAYSNLLFLYAYHALLDPREYLSLARGWERDCLSEQDRQAARGRAIQRLPLAGRRLKVGYVSGDYREHAVSYFVEQVFRNHDRARIELFAYSTHPQRDAVTVRLQVLVDHWVPLIGISDTTVRDRIEADGIDVLIDLSGHTAHNRLGVFARRAAPVQVYYLGYFASTGLREMDYWIGDEILTPAETDNHFSEKVWRLPRVCVSYEGKSDAPLPDWRPAQDGTVWVGSFNNLNKLTPATLALWARVLLALPEGRLLLKTRQLADAGNRRRILDAAASHGITASRIELQDSSITPDWPAHMAYYNRLDIALDPVRALGGITTTCDALWMALPVVTLLGDRMASRMTASMLNALGHPEWITQSEAEYVDKVVALARDVQRRKELRFTLRREMALSPLCDGRDLARNLENAYLDMFNRWLSGKNEQTRTASRHE